VIKQCAFCGAKFEANHSAIKYCSPRCKHKASWAKEKARMNPREPAYAICPICGKKFEQKNSNHKYCSSVCQQERAYREELKRKSAKRRVQDPTELTRRKKKKEPTHTGETLCWRCKKVTVGGCSWSKSHIPVEGWHAIQTKKVSYTSFRVQSCPEFERG